MSPPHSPDHPGLLAHSSTRTDWTPIERGAVKVTGVDSEHPGLLKVSITLTPEPPDEWCDRVARGLGVETSPDMHPISVYGRTVTMRPPDDELERYVRNLDLRIDVANRWYESETLPGLQAAEDAAARRADETAERIAKARRQADTL